MEECRRLALQGCLEGTVVSANFQNAGRGRFSRSWISPRGENLQISILIKPSLQQLPQANMSAALAISDSVEEITEQKGQIKWPNDVEVLGKKVAGILVESELTDKTRSFAIIGIGLNVNLQPKLHREIAGKATSLVEICNSYVSRAQTLRVLIHHLNFYYSLVKDNISLLEMWEARLNTLGKRINLSTQSQTVSGIAESVNEDGTINIRLDNGTVFTGSSGEVTIERYS